MSAAKHTPGPWDVSDVGIWAITPWNARVRIASATLFSRMNGLDSEANARLIAAAPDLLASLILMVRTHDEPADSLLDEVKEQQWLAQARAAIAKATGEAA